MKEMYRIGQWISVDMSFKNPVKVYSLKETAAIAGQENFRLFHSKKKIEANLEFTQNYQKKKVRKTSPKDTSQNEK